MVDHIPDQSLIIDNQPKGEDYIVATRAQDGSYAFVYSPTGKPFQLNTLTLFGSKVSSLGLTLAMEYPPR